LPAGQVTFVQGVKGYTGAADTGIDGWNPNTTYGREARIRVHQGGVREMLVHFDVSQLPPSGSVRTAKLRLYVCDRTNENATTLRAYRLLRPFVDIQANWNRASQVEAWGLPGATDSSDYLPEVVGEASLHQADGWIELDVTAAVQRWMAQPASNQGLILRAEGPVSVGYTFYSSEISDATVRPQLVVGFDDATPTPQAEPTAAVPGPSATRVPTLGPSLTPMPAAGSITLQQGLRSYFGATDTSLDGWQADKLFGTDGKLRVRQGGTQAALLRFDLPDTVASIVVQNATLRLYVVARSNANPLTIEAFRQLRPWVEREANWNRPRVGATWGQPGAALPGEDYAEALLAQAPLQRENTWVELDVTAAVLEWIANPQDNQGFLLTAVGNVSVQYDLASSDWIDRYYRPQLVLTYSQPTATPTGTPPTPTPSATPTFTPAPTATPTPTLPRVERVLQQGVADYNGTQATTLDSWNQAQNLSFRGDLIVRQGDVRSGLLRFDLSSVPAGVNLRGATLRLYAERSSNPNPMQVQGYVLRRDWTPAQATWLQAANGALWQAPGANGTGDRADKPLFDVTVSAAGQWIEADVTEAVRAWLNNPASNRGLLLKGGGEVSVEYYVTGPAWLETSQRPQLVLSWEVPRGLFGSDGAQILETSGRFLQSQVSRPERWFELVAIVAIGVLVLMIVNLARRVFRKRRV
jgi:hypothetical protein